MCNNCKESKMPKAPEIPMPPVKPPKVAMQVPIHMTGKYYHCPKCKSKMIIDHQCNYCPDCGQGLLWDNVNENRIKRYKESLKKKEEEWVLENF